MARYFALIPAAGRGTRMDSACPKQYMQLSGRPMLYHSLNALAEVDEIECVFVVLAAGDARWGACDWGRHSRKIAPLYCGGAARRESVINGLRLATGIEDDDYVLVHDAVRPCITPSLVRALLREAGEDGALLAIPVTDTLKRGKRGYVEGTLDREGLWRAQTPQLFRRGILKRALELSSEATDEAQAVEALGLRPKLVMGDERNLKVTVAGDLRLAEAILANRDE
jgi:2-C-methyl-D-erythritol 4-phosphate cytidylyltransferase